MLEFFKSMNGQANSLFMRHPLYAYNSEKTIKFHQPKIKIIYLQADTIFIVSMEVMTFCQNLRKTVMFYLLISK